MTVSTGRGSYFHREHSTPPLPARSLVDAGWSMYREGIKI